MSKRTKLTSIPSVRDTTKPLFSDDAIGGRESLAQKLSEFIPRLSNSGVIAINAPWGAGKTWFGHRWADMLKEQGHKVAYIDAFQQDHTEDPFLVIAAELSQLIDNDKRALFLAKAGEVASVVVPSAVKAAMHIGVKVALRGVEVGKEIEEFVKKAEEQSEDFAKHWIERKLESYEKEKKSLVGFRDALKQAAGREEDQRPIVVFVDELDRCRPDFAVRLIERIKHFFETPNVVFVLLLNREQLQRSVQGVYGSATDGDAYLSKFIHFYFTLPHPTTRAYIEQQLTRFGMCNDDRFIPFADALEFWRSFAALSLRDLERACALYAYPQNPQFPLLLAYLIALKIRRADLFNRLLNQDSAAHKECSAWLKTLSQQQRNGAYGEHDWQFSYLSEIYTIHEICAGGILEKLETPLSMLATARMSVAEIPNHIVKMLRLIDLPIG